jgi:lipoprotein-anchoring transpeptidase ErfK/SrfK
MVRRMSMIAGAAMLALMLAQAAALAQEPSETDALALQVELARAHASPGAIDGKMGKNTQTAIKAFQQMQGLEPTGEPDDKTREALQQFAGEPVTIDYTITGEDTKGPFVDEIPEKMEEQAKLDHLGYASPAEALAEKFHMDQDFLESLNKGKDLAEPGTVITVANLADAPPLEGEVKRIKVDKTLESVQVFDAGGKLVAQYPATIGSPDTPSPEGEHKIKGVAEMPEYTYDPQKLDFEGVESDEKFTIAPGPNNPVGVVWIDIDAPSYGIHGTAEPETIRRASSHGCVRLTNWDAMQLAKAVKPGIPVEFAGGGQPSE